MITNVRWSCCVRLACLAGLGCTIAAVGAAGAAARPLAGSGHSLAAGTRFFTPPPPRAAVEQEMQLVASGDWTDATAIARMLATPQAVWFDGVTPRGATQTPEQATRQARLTMAEAAAERAVPVLVLYDIPGRDCDQYSAGGALNEQDYDAWVRGVAAGLGSGQAVVILEPDALGNMPSDCLVNNPSLDSGNYPFTDAERLAELSYAVNTLEADPNVSVYLDGTHSAWQAVGTIAQRLVEAGVLRAQGFFLDVSNYQYTANNVQYGTWISDCVAYATAVDPGDFGNCPNQYWNGGPPNGWVGTALSPYGVWSDTTTTPDLNTAGIDARYADMLGSTPATTHFVIDTSRNGQGPNDMAAYAAAPYDQPQGVIGTLQSGNWCNPPASGLGVRPTADTGLPLVDAFLWVKIPGESDGQCDAAGGVRAWDYSAYTQPGWPTTAAAQSLFDPLWGIDDPAAGAWFPAQAIQLTRDADQSVSAPGNS